MKLIKGLNGFLAATVALMMAATSCTNNLNEFNGGKPAPSPMNGSVVRTPDAIVWSGNQVFGDSFTGTRSEGVTHDVYTSSYASNKGVKTRDASTTSDYFTVKNVTDDWNDVYVINNQPGPQSVMTFLKWGIDGWVDLDGQTWIKEEWIKQRSNHDSTGEVTIPACFPHQTKGDDAVELLNRDFSIKAKAGYSITFYPYISGQTDQTHKEIGLFYYDSEGVKHEEIIWDSEVSGYKDGKIEGVKVTANKDCTFGLYFSGRTHNAHEEDIYYYSMSSLNDPSEGSDYPEITVHAGMIPDEALNGFYNGHVLMVEDWDDFDFDDFIIFITGDVDLGHESDIVNPGTPPTGGDDDDDEDENCTVCGHPTHPHPGSGPCEDCDDDFENGGNDHKCHPETGGDEGSDDPVETPVGNEVEINLSILDVHTLPNGENKYDIDDLVSKLSMHVRYPHDIEVILPVPQSIYCDQDDLYILKTHDVGEYKYGGEKNELVYNIGIYTYDDKGNVETVEITDPNDQSKTITQPKITHKEVKLGVEFVSSDNDNLTFKDRVLQGKNDEIFKTGGYIRVYTEGIDEELITYLKNYYGDGINFEVYNYYNRGNNYKTGNYAEISYEFLQYHFLSHAFVNFDWNATGEKVLPDNYINAFHEVNNLPTKGDCYTWIIGDAHANINGVYQASGGSIYNSTNTTVTWNNDNQRFKYVDPYQGEHFNGSPYNWIYTLKSIGGADSSDMPDNAIWPFNNNGSLWQYYRVIGEGDYFNWGPKTGGSTGGDSTGGDSTSSGTQE